MLIMFFVYVIFACLGFIYLRFNVYVAQFIWESTGNWIFVGIAVAVELWIAWKIIRSFATSQEQEEDDSYQELPAELLQPGCPYYKPQTEYKQGGKVYREGPSIFYRLIRADSGVEFTLRSEFGDLERARLSKKSENGELILTSGEYAGEKLWNARTMISLSQSFRETFEKIPGPRS
ncbi:MAG: hypothetical protein IJK52_03440 [Oscillospiraceae bacterium]|nr:hypothetical protein [Oscillospiraceae bacterium]